MVRIFHAFVLIAFAAAAARTAAAAEPRPTWYDRSPKLAVMTGFIYEPLSPYTLKQWAEGLGNRFDADRWVGDFREAGASYLIFYDKWIDGFVFHDTKTTGFKTKRDFVGELAGACERRKLPLVLYFNAMTDGNPEFDKWSLIDRRGRALVFSPRWPTRVQTLHSPFREVSIRQVRELMTQYPRIDGLWLDIFRDRGLESTSEWVPKAFEKIYGKPLGQATARERAEFPLRTLADYLDEVRAIAAEHQPHCVWTANGSAAANLRAGLWSQWVGSRLDYGSNEGHQIGRIEQLARGAWLNDMPTEIGLLLNTSWFTPLKDRPPPPNMNAKQAIAATAMGVCQGASIYFALTPDHAGTFGGDLEVAKQVGAWFQGVRPLLAEAAPYADVGIVLGSPPEGGPGFAGSNTLWKQYRARQLNTLDEAFALSDALARAGAFSRLLGTTKRGSTWPESLAALRAIVVPERALLDDAHVERLRQYVRGGGRLIAFGHATMLDEQGDRRADYALADVFGARCRGELALKAEPGRTLVKVDSEYSPEFKAEHLVDDAPTAWASGGTPMPHWAEIILPEPAELAKVELASRSGPYLVADVDIEVPDGAGWRVVKSVRGAEKRLIAAALDQPLRTGRVRVKILRELYQGEDRQYADVEAIRLLDTKGRDLSTNRAASVELAASPELRAASEGTPINFPLLALDLDLSGAEVLARVGDDEGPPAIVRNRCGEGEAILVATSEGAVRRNLPFWAALRQLAIGGPTLRCPDGAMDRYRFILTEVGGQRVLHVIDRTGGGSGYQPEEVSVSLEAERLGSPAAATLPDGGALVLQRDGAYLTFVLRPDPVASVVFE